MFLFLGQSVTSVYAKYDQRGNDRRWKIQCGDNKAVKNCQWTSYVNHFKKPFKFECRKNGFITGMPKPFIFMYGTLAINFHPPE